MSCSEPRYRSVVWIDECPNRNLICSRSPPLFRHSLAQVRRRSWAPKCSIPICFDDCSTTDQMAQSPSSSRKIFHDFDTGRSRRPSSILAAVIQALIPCFTHIGTATVRILPPLPEIDDDPSWGSIRKRITAYGNPVKNSETNS
jgi:hypothetical protein